VLDEPSEASCLRRDRLPPCSSQRSHAGACASPATAWPGRDPSIGWPPPRLPLVSQLFHLWLGNRVAPAWSPIESLLEADCAIEESNAESLGVTRGFFEAMGLRPQAGRLPTDEELTAFATDEKPTMISLLVQFDARGSMDLRLMLSLLSSRYPMFRVRSAESVVATLGVRERGMPGSDDSIG
jgi:hypothetical protein